MELDNINIACVRCRKKRATTLDEANTIFGICNTTKTWYKQCTECRKQNIARYHKKSILEDNSKVRCKKCSTEYNQSEIAEKFGFKNNSNEPFKHCVVCREKKRALEKKTRTCVHGHYKESCKVCCTRCIHGKSISNTCFICRPNSKRVKRLSKPAQKCEHDIIVHKCKLCNLCKHNKHRNLCKACFLEKYRMAMYANEI